jgi:hypothetical protein
MLSADFWAEVDSYGCEPSGCCDFILFAPAPFRHSVSILSAVPSQVQLLAREVLLLHGRPAAAPGAPCTSLRRVLSGGEALTLGMAQEINRALPRCNLYNTYGPTETTVGKHGSCLWPAVMLCSATLSLCLKASTFSMFLRRCTERTL